MKQEIKIPQMGESISEAIIGTILKLSGAFVKENEEIVELETEKVNQVLYSPIEGVLSWSVQEGQTVKIGDVIGFVDNQKQSNDQEVQAIEKPKVEIQKNPAKSISQPVSGQRIMVNDYAEELKQASQNAPTEPEKQISDEKRETRRPMSKIRQTIAKRLVDSLHSAAMLTTFNEVDMSEIINLRLKHKESFLEKHGVKLGLMSFFVKAVVEGLKAFPDFNSYLEGQEIVTRLYYDIGIAIGAEKGLIVPIIRDCDFLTFADIEKQILNFVKKSNESKLSIEDLQGGGFTITNGGIYGSMLSTPILNPPQVGILGMHKIMKRAVVIDDNIVVRPMMNLALSYDHRIVDGKEAVSFLVHVKNVLEDPTRLLLD